MLPYKGSLPLARYPPNVERNVARYGTRRGGCILTALLFLDIQATLLDKGLVI